MFTVSVYKPGVKKLSKNENTYCIQEGWIQFPDSPHPEKFEFFPPRDLPDGYQPGLYDFDPTTGFKVERGRLEVNELRLMNPRPLVKK